MRKISRKTALSLLALSAVFESCVAQAENINYISQNIQGFNLPGVQLPQGADEVRAADGTTCRSAVSGSGAYLDVGVIGTPSSSGNGTTASAYGRIVIPLGRRPKRLDCSELYALEVERLKMELRLMQMGLGNQGAPADMSATASTSGEAPTAELADDGTEPAETQGAGRLEGKKPKTQQASSTNNPAWADEGWTTEGKE